MVAESSGFNFTLNRAHFSSSKYAKKRDFLSEKRESEMALKKHEFTPESGNVDTSRCRLMYIGSCHGTR